MSQWLKLLSLRVINKWKNQRILELISHRSCWKIHFKFFFSILGIVFRTSSDSQWALYIPTYGLIVGNEIKLGGFSAVEQWQQTEHLPPGHIFYVAVGSTAAESPLRKRCQRSNYKQHIYSGQSPQRGWSFVEEEQRKTQLHSGGVVSVLFILTRWIIKAAVLE